MRRDEQNEAFAGLQIHKRGFGVEEWICMPYLFGSVSITQLIGWAFKRNRLLHICDVSIDYIDSLGDNLYHYSKV